MSAEQKRAEESRTTMPPLAVMRTKNKQKRKKRDSADREKGGRHTNDSSGKKHNAILKGKPQSQQRIRRNSCKRGRNKKINLSINHHRGEKALIGGTKREEEVTQTPRKKGGKKCRTPHRSKKKGEGPIRRKSSDERDQGK